MGGLRICLFGSIRIVCEQTPAELKLAPKAQALLAYLLIHGPRLHPRDVLIDIFWQDQHQARDCLNTALWRLKRVLEPAGVTPGTYLVTRPEGEVGFNWASEHWLDMKIFEEQARWLLSQPIQALSSANITSFEETLQLYTGDLLHGFYDDWAIAAQERLRCLYLDCLQQLMRYYHYSGQHDKSLACGRQILVLEPLHEEIHREIMRLHVESGQRALAVRQYQQCREVLSRELDISPMPETDALYRQAIDGAGQSEPAATLTVPVALLRQLFLATQDFDEAQQQFKVAQQSFAQATQQLRRALQLLERSLGL